MGDFRWDVFSTLNAENKKGMHVTMATEKSTLTMKLSISLEILINELCL